MPKAVEWALVAAAECSQVQKRRGGAAWAGRPVALSSPENPASRQHDTARPGRAHESVGSADHATKPRKNRHRAAKASFARHLAALRVLLSWGVPGLILAVAALGHLPG